MDVEAQGISIAVVQLDPPRLAGSTSLMGTAHTIHQVIIASNQGAAFGQRLGLRHAPEQFFSCKGRQHPPVLRGVNDYVPDDTTRSGVPETGLARVKRGGQRAKRWPSPPPHPG